MLKVDLPKNQSSIIKVIGVGGGGSNAVNYMYNQGINGVDFIICNTDAQALDSSPIPTKIQLGKGLGAGNNPEVAQKAAHDKSEEIKAILEKNTQMLFITAGMGGGTGTGAAPVIASIAKEIELSDDLENKILTVAIVTLPFSFEGRKRKLQAEEGIKELRKYVDAILVINNDKLREFGNLSLNKAFEKADNILTTAAKGIAEIITVKAFVNIDFRDVNTVMKKSGVALMGSGVAEGENRAYKAIEMAINSPLLNDNNIEGAQNILLYFASGTNQITMDEIAEISDYIVNEAGKDVDIIWGAGQDDTLGEKLSITLVATGFDKSREIDYTNTGEQKRRVIPLDSPISEQHPVVTYPKEVENLNEISLIDKPYSSDNFKNPEIGNPINQNQDAYSYKPETRDENEPYLLEKQNGDSRNEKNANESISKELKLNDDDMNSMAIDRQTRLRNMSIGMRPIEDLTELESLPAFQRRNVPLTEVKPSSETDISRYTLDSNNDIKQNNKFLHDRPD